MIPCPDPRWLKWWDAYVRWCDAGRHPAIKPRSVPRRIPDRARDVYRLNRSG